MLWVCFRYLLANVIPCRSSYSLRRNCRISSPVLGRKFGPFAEMSVVLLSPPGAALSSSTCGLGSVRAERWLSHEVMNPTLERAPSMETSWGDESLSTIMSRAVFSGKFSWRFSEKHAGCQRRMSGSPVFVNRSLYRAGSRFPRIQERRRKEVERTSIDMFGLVNEFMLHVPSSQSVPQSVISRSRIHVPRTGTARDESGRCNNAVD